MSIRNKTKPMRRAARQARKVATRNCMPSPFIWVRKADVKGHRYLASKGLPHSAELAAVVISKAEEHAKA